MKPSNASLRGSAVALVVVTLAAPAHSAPKKTVPVPATPAVEPAPPAKQGMFGKIKSLVGRGDRPEAAPAAPEPAPSNAKSAARVKSTAAKPAQKAPAPVPGSAAKPDKPAVAKANAKSEKNKPAEALPAPAENKPGFIKRLFTREDPPAVPAKPPAATAKAADSKSKEKVPAKKTEVAAAPAEEKKGFLKRLFTRDAKPDAETESEPKLAKAKTARPGPVPELKPQAGDDEDAPAEKRGFLSFFRRFRSEPGAADVAASAVPDAMKTERPDDWSERRVTTDDGIALYEFGPAQTSPDARIDKGTVVKVKNVRSGWALVEIDGGRTGYIDAHSLRVAEKTDFLEPVVPMPAVAATDLLNWAPAAPPPDLPEQPGPLETDPALLLLPPLELEPKPNP